MRRRSRHALVMTALATAGALALAGPVSAGSQLPIEAHQIRGSFEAPVFVASAPGFRSLLFVVEKDGVVRVLRDGRKRRRPFLDIRSLVSSDSAFDERGLLSIAFPPDYRRTRRFYVYFNNRSCEGVACDIEVAEFRRSRARPARALRRSYRKVMSIHHRDAGNHNGGTAMFGPDGKLWLATGDGGGGGDQFDNARRRGSLLGKLLRINPRRPRRAGATRGYRIPRNNPFVGKPGRDEIWSIGLRNPFRFSFDRARSAIAVGDVGQGTQEEVNFVSLADAKGANFGWPQYEGTALHDASRPGKGPLITPMHTYSNPALAPASVIGGVVLRDRRFADVAGMPGRYLFADAYEGPLRSFVPDPASNSALDPRAGPASVPFPAGFGLDRRRRVHVASLSDGRVYRLDPSP